LQLEGGEPFAPTPEFVKDAMKRALDANQTRYAPSSGIPQLLDAIRDKLAERNRIAVSHEQLIAVAGGMHGLFCAFQATLDPGDETIFFSPFWTPIRDLVHFSGGVPIFVPWSELREGNLAEMLERRITPRTRVIYVNSPANPTGDALTGEQLRAIAQVAIARNLVVIADEAYEDIIYDEPHVSIASLPEMASRTITVFTLSKSYSMTGWRVGYVVADNPFMDVIRKLVLNSVNGVSTPTQHGAAAAVADRSDHLRQMLSEYRMRRDLLVDGVSRAGFDAVAPAGAFYLFVDVRSRLGNDSWAAMNHLLELTGIATVPGVVFGQEGEGHLRMSFSTPIETLERAIDALQKL
ncbi:MAG TPA: aminotransferase class I/II-fold pyridoxal phosphate-dependent enzyme, partial [Thermoanaerobaculia bacterium]|nr:aminotransferase class I/II-fold pyridoxal phosphate-dependent enzyme [Thermoanaerobaculia bacterium]